MFLGPSGKRYPTTGTSSSTLESPPYSPSGSASASSSYTSGAESAHHLLTQHNVAQYDRIHRHIVAQVLDQPPATGPYVISLHLPGSYVFGHGFVVVRSFLQLFVISVLPRHIICSSILHRSSSPNIFVQKQKQTKQNKWIQHMIIPHEPSLKYSK